MSLEPHPRSATPSSIDAACRTVRTSVKPEPPAGPSEPSAEANGHNGAASLTLNVAEHEQCTMREAVNRALRRYFDTLEGDTPCDLHALVIGEVEPPLLEAALRECGGNQSRAASMLGINRATLRKKLLQYGLIPGA